MNKTNVSSRRHCLVKRTTYCFSDTSAAPQYIIDEAADQAGVTRRVWLRYWRWGLADSGGNVNSNQRQFDEDAIYRVRRAEEIRRAMKTDLRSAATIVQLLERVEKLERELDFYR